MAPPTSISSSNRGLLIVIEGLDRSGKSSQCQRLVDFYMSQGRKIRYVKFPDRTTPTGMMIDQYLTGAAQQDDHSIHLIFSANRWEAIASIKADLLNGVNIIVDRYSFSGAVYSAAKGNPGLSLEWAWSPEIGLLKPDLVFFLDLSAEAAAKRGGYGEERYEKEEMQKRVRDLFQDLFARLDENVHRIDAGRSVEVVEKDITGVIEKNLRDGAGVESELETLGALRDIVA